MAWYNDSRRHSLASRGVKTASEGKPIVTKQKPLIPKAKIPSFSDLESDGELLSDGSFDEDYQSNVGQERIYEYKGETYQAISYYDGDYGDPMVRRVKLDPEVISIMKNKR